MDIEAFGGAPGIPGWVRLALALVAGVHCLLSIRVVLTRLVRYSEPAHPERVPTAAMVAYALLTANVVRTAVLRIPGAAPLVWSTVVLYALALLAGTIAFSQIVVLTRRAKRVPEDDLR